MRLFAKEKPTKDNYGEYHMPYCYLRDRKITVIDNFRGRKLHPAFIKYCPWCGTKIGEGK